MMHQEYYMGQSDERPWGTWKVVEVNSRFVVKTICVKPGEKLSLQLHEFRSEHWVVVEGQGAVTLGGDKIRVQRGSHIFVPRKTKHRIANDGSSVLIFVEVQVGDRLDEHDIIRLEDDYYRATGLSGT